MPLKKKFRNLKSNLEKESSYYIQKAIQISESNTEYIFRYAKIYEKIGLKKEAEITYKELLKFNKSDIEIWLDYSNIVYEMDLLIKQ